MPALHSILNFKFKILNSRQRRGGFTLIELMITISIIAIISAVGLISYSRAQMLGRDAKRKQDLRSIAIALELFYQTNKRYPIALDAKSTNADPWITDTPTDPEVPPVNFDSKYINNLPKDPSDGDYVYTSHLQRNCVEGEYFILKVLLENEDDPDRWELNPSAPCSITNAGWDGHFVISQDK